MARLLGLDWDHNQLHLVSATTSRSGVRIDKATVVPLNQNVKPAEAEVLGKSLRERLKKQGFTLAPAVACIGRDRVILKEIRFPNVPASEEPALVRFQATKDASEAVEDTSLDYTPLAEPGPNGERQALVVMIRKEIPATLNALCRGIGVKVLALTPRPFGMSAALRRAAGDMTPPPGPAAVVGVLVIGERWAEFCIVQGDAVLFTRALGVGPSLAGEVKRTLAIFGSQANGKEGRKLESLYVAGNGEHAALREQLEQIVGLPVHPLDPFSREERVDISASNRGGFTGIVGVLHAWAEKSSLPINLLRPKEPVVRSNPRKTNAVRAGIIAAACLAIVVGIMVYVFSIQRSKIAILAAEKKEHEDYLALLAQDDKDIKGLKEWEQTTISWLDELYELSAKFPYRKGLHLTSLTVGPAPKKTGKDAGKDSFIGRVMIKGVVLESDGPLINALVAEINKDKNYRASSVNQKGKQFDFAVDLGKQSRYVTRLIVPPGAKRDEQAAEGNGALGGAQ